MMEELATAVKTEIEPLGHLVQVKLSDGFGCGELNYPVKDGALIGRISKHCDVVISNPLVSRIQAKIYREGENVFFETLSKTNASVVKMIAVHWHSDRVKINDGDQIEMGEVKFVWKEREKLEDKGMTAYGYRSFGSLETPLSGTAFRGARALETSTSDTTSKGIWPLETSNSDTDSRGARALETSPTAFRGARALETSTSDTTSKGIWPLETSPTDTASRGFASLETSPPDGASKGDRLLETTGVKLANNPSFKASSGVLGQVVIDGNNVGMAHGRHKQFSVKGLSICVEYFQKLGHKTIVMMPKHRWSRASSKEKEVLDDMERSNVLFYTPGRKTETRTWICYDDRFLVEYAARHGGVVLTNDNYLDLADEPKFTDTIENRLLPYMLVEDTLMIPDDPMGRGGPNIEQFLRK